MPKLEHDGTIEIVREDPAAVADFLHEVGYPVPEFTEARVERGDLPDVSDRRADLIVLLKADKPELAVIFEVQRGRDEEKRESWPYYVSAARMRFHCPAVLLVFSPKKGIAAWCAKPIETGHPGFVLTPIVLGPGNVPRITDPDEAARHVQLALLSVMSYPRDPAIKDIIRAAFQAFDRASVYEATPVTLYYDIAIASLPEAVARWAEAQMVSETYEFQSNFFRKKIADAAKEAAREAARTAAKETARTTAAKSKAEAIISVLQARQIEIPEATAARINGTADLPTLDKWIRRAAVVANADEIFTGHAKR